ncbi:glycosyltransferase family 2 protein [Capnocytophaga canis]|uniref:glycosyltransferase family 2 protein n=1 Tax=Capnocytophaga canis TaxID=1848903 RepID=UPI0015622086|nr:glycosyltransferase [Capnocytophaga canis]
MEKGILFSIVIPTYNHAHLLGRCLDSIVNQTYPNWEVIVVNNASTDNTIEVIERYKKYNVRYVNFNNDQGIAASRNVGLRVAQGDFVCFLDSDDWWKENKLEVCSLYTDNYDLIHHDLDIVYSEKGKGKFRKKIRGRDISKDNFLEDVFMNGNPIKNSSVVLSTKFVKRIGFLDENLDLKAVEDFDYWIRAFKAGAKVRYIPESLGYYWMGNNTSYRLIQIQRNRDIFNKYANEIKSEQVLGLINKNLMFQEARIYHSNRMFFKAFKLYFKSLDVRLQKSKLALIGIFLCLFRIKV